MAKVITMPSKRLANKLARMMDERGSAMESARDARDTARAWWEFAEHGAIAAEKADASPVLVGRMFGESPDGGQGPLMSETELVSPAAAKAFADGVKPGVYADIASKDAEGGEETVAYVQEVSEQDGYDEDGNPSFKWSPSADGIRMPDGGEVTAESIEERLAELGANSGLRTEAQLRADIGLDFPMADGAALAKMNSDQVLKHLQPVILTAMPGEDGRYPKCFYDVAEAIGRGVLSANELRFVAPGLERTFSDGTAYAPAEQAEMFGHVDKLVPGEGIVRDSSRVKRTVGDVLRGDGKVPLAGGGIYDAEEAFGDVREME